MVHPPNTLVTIRVVKQIITGILINIDERVSMQQGCLCVTQHRRQNGPQCVEGMWRKQPNQMELRPEEPSWGCESSISICHASTSTVFMNRSVLKCRGWLVQYFTVDALFFSLTTLSIFHVNVSMSYDLLLSCLLTLKSILASSSLINDLNEGHSLHEAPFSACCDLAQYK